METALRTVVLNYRSSHRRCSVRKVVLKNFTKFTGKHLYQTLFFNKVAGLKPATLLKKRLWLKCFPVNFAKVFRTPFLQNNSGRLLLKLEVNALRRSYQEALKKHEMYHVCLLKNFHIFFIFFMFFKHNGN